MLMSWKKFFMYLSTQALVRISLIFAYFNFSPHKQTYSWLLRPNWASSFTFCQYIKLIYFYSVLVNLMICSSKSTNGNVFLFLPKRARCICLKDCWHATQYNLINSFCTNTVQMWSISKFSIALNYLDTNYF